MSVWPSSKANRVRAALGRVGWITRRHLGGSHELLQRAGWPDFTWAFHDRDEIGPKMLARIAKHTGLQPSDL